MAPVRTFIIRPKYIHGLSQETKILMKDRDKKRSAPKSKTHSQLERKALMINYLYFYIPIIFTYFYFIAPFG